MTFNRTTQETLNDKPNYGDGKFQIGTVTNNEDPMGLARIQAAIPNTFDPSLGEIPWLGPMKFSNFGQGPGFGVYGSPAVGSKVLVVMQEGDTLKGFYMAGAYTSDIANPEFASPKVWGWTDPSGNKLIVNMETQTMTVVHSSGYTEVINENGDVVRTIPGKVEDTITGTMSVHATGNVLLRSDGNVTVIGTRIDLNP